MPSQSKSKGKKGRRTAKPSDPTKAKTKPGISSTHNRCPINDSLPVELLAHIFALGCMLDRDENSTSHATWEATLEGFTATFDRRLPFELLVSRICRQWRNVIIETPSVWSNIIFTPDTSPAKVKEYISRAKGTPLDILISCSHLLEITPDTLAEATKALLPHVDQWMSFTLRTDDFLFLTFFLIQLSQCNSALILEHLELEYRYTGPAIDNALIYPPGYKKEYFVLFHNQLPALRELILRGVYVDWNKMPFSTLRDLRLAFHPPDVRPTYRDFLNILRASTDLHTLELSASGPSGSPEDWTKSIQEGKELGDTPNDTQLGVSLPLVVHLDIALLPPDYILALLEHIRLPGVISLRLNLHSEPDDYQTVINQLSTPGPKGSKPLLAGVETLKLSGLHTSDESSMFKAMQCLTSMKILHINFRRVDYSTWLDLLSIPSSIDDASDSPDPTCKPEVSALFSESKTLFPRLETIYITGLSGALVKEMVVQRRQDGHPLKNVYLNSVEWLAPDDEAWLKGNLEVFEVFDDLEDEEPGDMEDEDEDADYGSEEDYDDYYDSDNYGYDGDELDFDGYARFEEERLERPGIGWY